jgi:hypothetical protein
VNFIFGSGAYELLLLAAMEVRPSFDARSKTFRDRENVDSRPRRGGGVSSKRVGRSRLRGVRRRGESAQGGVDLADQHRPAVAAIIGEASERNMRTATSRLTRRYSMHCLYRVTRPMMKL